MTLVFRRIESPVGPLAIAADETGLRHIEFHENRHPADRSDWRGGDNAILQAAERQLDDYFAGTRRTFDLPLAPVGTAFQRSVWQALAEIPYGQTISYATLARRLPGLKLAVPPEELKFKEADIYGMKELPVSW